MKKRIISMLLTVLMVVSLFPSGALAAENAAGDGSAENPYQIGDIVINDGSAEPEGYTAANSRWTRTSDVPASESVACTLEEHDHAAAGCDDACALEEHKHTVENGCITVTPAYTVWTLEQHDEPAMFAANDAVAPIAEDTSLPIHFFLASPGNITNPNGSYVNYYGPGYSDWTGAYTVQGIQDSDAWSQMYTQTGIRNVYDESTVTQYIASWPNGYDAASFKDFGSVTIGRQVYTSDKYEIKWVSIMCRDNDSNNSGLRCNQRNFDGPHIHVDGLLVEKVQPGDMEVYKSIPSALTKDLRFNFTLQKMLQNSLTSPPASADAIDGSFAPMTLTATIPAGQTEAQIIGGSEISFGYYKLTENAYPGWLTSGIALTGSNGRTETVSTNTLYICIAPNGTVQYSTSVSGPYSTMSHVSVINTYDPAYDLSTSVGAVILSGVKHWDDNNNEAGHRPGSITVILKADGQEIQRTSATAPNWSYSFDVSTVPNPTEVEFTVEELPVAGYTLTEKHDPDVIFVSPTDAGGWTRTTTCSQLEFVNETASDGEVIRQTVVLAKTTDQIAVFWTPNPLAQHERDIVIDSTKGLSGLGNPKSYLFFSGEGESVEYGITATSTTVTFEATNNWSMFWVGTFHRQSSETADCSLTNALSTITIQAQKVWDDDNNRDGIRPDSVTVELLANGTLVETAVLSNATSWTKQWHNMPEYANGKKITYTIQEISVPAGYTAAYSSDETGRLYVTNTHAPETIEVTAVKHWEDDNNRDGIRPDSVVLTLYADGIPTGKTVTVTKAGNWTASISGLEKYVNENGVVREIVYTLVERNAPAGYQSTTNGTSVTNTHTIETIDVPVNKVWNDANDQDGKRPDEIIVVLYADGVEVARMPITATGNWAGIFEDMPKYKAGAVGQAIRYTVDEAEVPEGYTKSVNGTTITNSHTPETDTFTVIKKWHDFDNNDGKRPYAVEIELYKNGQPTGRVVTLTAENQWTASWADVPLYEEGVRISYTTVEVAAYITAEDLRSGNPTNVSDTGYTVRHDDYDRVNHISTVTNSYTPELVTLDIQKTWNDGNNQDGIQPDSVTFYLWMTTDAAKLHLAPSEANGWTQVKGVDGAQMSAILARHTDGSWIDAEFTGLPKYKSGNVIYYAVTEKPIAGYTPSYELDPAVGMVHVTNTHEVEKTDVTVTKVWDDANNQDGIRPTSVTLYLYGRDKQTPIDEQTISADANGNWSYTWTGLDKNYAGQEIIYTIREKAVEGYTPSYVETSNRTAITNHYTPETTSVDFAKIWDDAGNQDGIRPRSITITLYANGEAVDTKTVTAAQNWSGTFENLPKYDAGNVIVYTVDETDVPAGYTKSVSGNVITNSHATEKTSVEARKVWVDNNNQDGLRPQQITLVLYANNVEVDRKTVSAAENWAYTWNNLDKFAGGAEIVYTVDEAGVPDGYTKTVDGNVITNTHVPATTDITVTKIWNDDGNRDNKRPRTIVIRLFADGASEPVREETVFGFETTWTHTFTDLPVKNNGAAITYTVDEAEVPAGYTKTVNGTTITNTYTPETTSVSFNKVWRDSNNQDGKRPENVTVILYADGIEKQRMTVGETENWEGTFDNLPKYQTGKVGQLITYTVDEAEVPAGYTKLVSGTTITNAYTPETVAVSVSKAWDDANDQDGIRPESVTVRLSNGESVRLDASNGWKHTFTNLPRYENGVEIQYTITEDAVTGYTAQITGDAATGYHVTNKHIPETTTVSVEKVWNDNDNVDDTRPASITLHIRKNGEHMGESYKKVVKPDANGDWTASWTNLPKYEEGKLINYTVEEEPVGNGYYSGGEWVNGVFRLTNTRAQDKVALTVQKRWDDANNQDNIRPYGVVVQLYADGTAYGNPVTLTAANNWHYVWVDLPENAAGAEGEAIAYTVEELHYVDGNNNEIKLTDLAYTQPDGVDGIVDAMTGTVVITNKHIPDTINIPVTKVWADGNNQDGLRVPVKVALYRNGENTGKTVTLSEANGWTAEFKDLPVHHGIGVDNIYTVEEVETPAAYTVEITGDAAGFTVTNTHTPEVVDIPFEKVWNDANNQDGLRPQSIEITLYADGKAVQTKTVSAAENWSGTFENLPKFDAGTAIGYTVDEATVPAGYEKTVAGSTITNTHVPETISVTTEKVWEDNGNQDGKRPATVTVYLLANGVPTGSAATLSETNGWKHSWDGLDKFDGGAEIAYSVKEAVVGNGYHTTIDGFTVTNTYEPEKTSVNVWKQWDDANNQDGYRPAKITVKLYANGQEKASAELSAQNGWHHSFSGLDKYAGGVLIDYTIDEVRVDQYTTKITGNAATGYTITNTHEAEKTEVTAEKAWDDAENQDGKRPTSVTLYLYGRDKQTPLKEQTISADASGNWSYTWTGLDKNYAGQEIIYTVREKAVDGYTPSYVETSDHTSITNHHTPETTSVDFVKVWDDAGNQDGLRPRSVTVTLYANGEAVDTKTVTAAQNWSGTFENLPKYKEGALIAYTVDETEVPAGYTKSVSGNVITNSHIPITANLNVEKAWDDFNNNDGKRPYAVEITLLKNGDPTSFVLILQENNNWHGVWENMPRYENGNLISYSVLETAYYQTAGSARTPGAPEGYSVMHRYDSTDYKNPVATVTNSYTPVTTGLNVQKTWDDDHNREGKRPSEITVTLYRKIGDNGTWEMMKGSNGKPISAVLNAENEWDADFTGLPAYKDGQKIIYNVVEDDVAGYNRGDEYGEPTDPKYVLNPNTNVVTITNTRKINRDVSVEVTKVWDDMNDQDGIRPYAVVVELYANGIPTGVTKVISAETAGGKVAFTGLYDYYIGKQVIYTVEEVGYYMTAEAYNNGLGEMTKGVPVGYKASVSTVHSDGSNVVDVKLTNRHEPSKISIPVYKTWDDANDQDRMRPGTVEVTLCANGVKTAQVLKLSADTNWSGVFANVDEYAQGEKIAYTIVETAITGYNVDEDGVAQDLIVPVKDGMIDIVNVHEVMKTTVTVNKQWDDANDQDGKRPDSISVHLLADGVHMGESYKKVITPDADGNWTCTWDGLDMNHNGQPIRYTVYEEPVEFEAPADGIDPLSAEGYEPYYERISETEIEITNVYTPEITSVTVRKAWADDDNRDGIRPEKITVELVAVNDVTGQPVVLGDEVELKVELTEDSDWTYTWSALPKYENHGQLIDYSVKEVEVGEGYDCEVSAEDNVFTLTNSHESEVTGIVVSKIWEDEDNNDGKRPDGIIVQLFADGAEVEGGRAVLTEESDWTYKFEHSDEMPLYVYNQGELIKYHVKEVGHVVNGVEIGGMPGGYEAVITDSGYEITVTNTRASEKISLAVSKLWDDADNNDGMRPRIRKAHTG